MMVNNAGTAFIFHLFFIIIYYFSNLEENSPITEHNFRNKVEKNKQWFVSIWAMRTVGPLSPAPPTFPFIPLPP